MERAEELLKRLRDEVGRVVVGQAGLVEGLLVGLLSGGHVLVEGVPGLAKTTAVRTLATALGLGFRRIQFTPDLLPGDLTGNPVFVPDRREFEVRRGPLFHSVLLADEINRAPAKVQSALLEAMEERQVTIGEETLPLPDPFFVMATQNPVELEGTYPLPEAQVDRFLLKLVVPYPSEEEEREIVARDAAGAAEASAVAGRERLGAHAAGASSPVSLGASPRASIFLVRAARARALLAGRRYTTPHDVKRVAPDVLRHRVLVSYEAEADGIAPEAVIEAVLAALATP
jgi:MoxR-like ATPase